ncbi:MAG: puuB 1 [Verrucomicrobiaceae bacterium]|nr:puuB 1 [Verrucomicrobiaceae bacterium]
MKQESLWQSGSHASFPSLTRKLSVEVLIIGGGITGVTAAYLLKKAGKKVALVERKQIVSGETGHTTAHVTYPTDTRLTKLIKTFGKDHAQAAWDAQSAAADQINAAATEERIKCELRHVPGFLYAAHETPVEKEAPHLVEDFQAAADMGFDVSYVQSAPVVERPAIRFANQLKLHPRKYLEGLAHCIAGNDCHVYENSEVTEFGEDSKSVVCNGHQIFYEWVFVATHVPLQGKTGTTSAMMFQTKLSLYSSYVLGATLPPGTLPEALWWDTSDPYTYLRVDRHQGHDYVIIGGEDHKTGQETDTEGCYFRLEQKLHRLLPSAKVDRRWSGQVIETNDGLPFIGETEEAQYVAAGYSGTGITWGTVAAMMFRDHVLGVANPWADLLSVNRKPLSKTWDYLKENKDYPYYLVKGLLTGAGSDVEQLKPGEGKLMRCSGKKVAAYRQEDGTLRLLSPVCPHLGCTVAWNNAEKSWDCPCHGSRFSATGELIGGPAETSLEPVKSN